ncbi:MAG: ABC transporter ATP-binding protein [Candidatus Competibacterales bacterium]|nr:ABC transporter ATP-binding protein [Candidatus Competibacterales bacterium]
MSELQLQGIRKHFRRERVLEDLSLAVEQGETVAVLGPSGSGKTVLLRLIAGVLLPDGGDIRLGGASITHLPPERRDVGMAFQSFALYPHLSAFDNIASPLQAQRVAAPEIRRRVGEIAELLRITHVLEHLPRALSNGQKQRTSLARALVSRPGVLLLDDPLRNVDAKLRYEMRLELPRLLRGFESIVLYVTQDYREAMALGDRVGVLLDRRFSQLDRPRAVYGDPANVEIARLFGDPTINLYRCRPENGQVELFGAPFALPPAIAAHRGECLIGLRPEAVEVSTEPGEHALAVELDTVMPLNVRAVMLLRAADGSEILSSCPENRVGDFGRDHRRVWARIDPDRALYFDAASGARLDRH